MSMDEQESVQIVPIPSPWRDVLLQAIILVQRELFIICPYIKEEVITALKTALLASQESRASHLHVRVLTRVRADELLTGSSDLSALQQLLNWPLELADSSVELRAIDNIHAKVWIIDSTRAIVGSGNATPSGLDENLEYGLAVIDPAIVARICQDWERWWVQAPVVNEQQLEQMQDWLTRNSQLLQEVENARREIVRTVGPSPRVGQRLSPRSRRPVQVTPPPAPNRLAEAQQVYATLEAITASHAYLLAALRWVYPFAVDQSASSVILPANAFLKLTWDKSASQIHFTWANGQRRSQASIPARGGEASSSWAITINLKSAQSLISELVHLEKIASLTGRSLKEDPQLLLSSFEQKTWDLQLKRGSIIYNHSVTLTSPPPVFPHLQGPISRITGIEHRAQLDMLAHHSHFPASIWLHLAGSDSATSLIFSDNSLENPGQFIIPNTQSQLAGPPVSLQIAYSDLQQALLGAPESVSSWSIEIDRNAAAIQLLPEVDDEIVRLWRHHLWHVGE